MKISKTSVIILGVLLIAYIAFRLYAFYRQDDIAQKNSSSFNRNIEHLILTKHAKCRMDCRNITEEEIKEILHDGNINSIKVI